METKIMLNRCENNDYRFGQLKKSEYFTFLNSERLYCKISDDTYENTFDVYEGKLCDIGASTVVVPVKKINVSFFI